MKKYGLKMDGCGRVGDSFSSGLAWLMQKNIPAVNIPFRVALRCGVSASGCMDKMKHHSAHHMGQLGRQIMTVLSNLTCASDSFTPCRYMTERA